MRADAKRCLTDLGLFLALWRAGRALAAARHSRAGARTWTVALLVALSLLAGPPAARAIERLVFDQFIGALLVPPDSTGNAVDPLRAYDIPANIAVDSRGVVYVADPLNNRVQVFNGSTVTSLTSFCCIVIRDATTGQVIATLNPILNFPLGVAVAPGSDDVWIANNGAAEVIKIDKNGVLLAVVGSRGTGNGQFESPVAVAVDPAGNLYVADEGPLPSDPNFISKLANFRIQKFKSDGTFLLSWGSFCFFNSTFVSPLCNTSAGPAVGDGQFRRPAGVAADSMGSVYVTDIFFNRVQKFNSSGTFLLKWGTLGNNNGQFSGLRGIAVDFADNVYTTEVASGRVQKFDGSGTFLTTVGSTGTGLGVFSEPLDIAATPKALVQFCQLLGLLNPTILLQCQKIFVVEQGNKRVQVLEARPDTDNDSILDEVDLDPTTFSDDAGLGDTGAVVRTRGGAPFVVYAPTVGTSVGGFSVQPNTIRVTAETTALSQFGHFDVFLFCTNPNSNLGFVNFVADNAFQTHCSTPTLEVLTGPMDWTFTAPDGTVATATLNGGDSLSVDPTTSSIRSNAGTLALVVGGTSIALAPAQSVFADRTAPTTNAAPSPGPNQNGWNNADVTVALTAADNAGGSGVKEIQFSLAGAQTGAGIVSGGAATVPISANGITTLTYFARDNAGNQEAARTSTVRIDKSGPAIAGLPAPGCTLWPPNHKLVEVATVTPGGSLSGIVPGSLSVVATSNEPEAGAGAGDTSPDVVVTGGVVQLRAERSGAGRGRVYTITATVADLAGTTVTATASCSVPLNQR